MRSRQSRFGLSGRSENRLRLSAQTTAAHLHGGHGCAKPRQSGRLGPPGVGKTHLSVSVAEAAIQAGFRAYFITAHDLVTDLGRAYREGRLDRRMRIYLAPKILIIDEMGYLPLDDLGATIFFQLVSARYERGSIILTSNKSYGDSSLLGC